MVGGRPWWFLYVHACTVLGERKDGRLCIWMDGCWALVRLWDVGMSVLAAVYQGEGDWGAGGEGIAYVARCGSGASNEEFGACLCVLDGSDGT